MRLAIGLAFDFEWANKNLMFDNSYVRTQSFFQNSPLWLPACRVGGELALLEPLRGQIPDGGVRRGRSPTVSDGSGRDREKLAEGFRVLDGRGLQTDGSGLLPPTAAPFTVEFLIVAQVFEPHTKPISWVLRLIGIEATYRTLDPAQYTERQERLRLRHRRPRFSTVLYPDEGVQQLLRLQERRARGLLQSLRGLRLRRR